jgi:NAD(P)-dependent dehydrogenase (short-subunit alcohol dehydrogenase family)
MSATQLGAGVPIHGAVAVVTDAAAVFAAAAGAGDATIVINNAGAMLGSPFLSASDPDAARKEMDTNYFGTLTMGRAFAPVLASNGGGALVNVLSVASFYSLPFNASYCASKAAEWSLTNALRLELHRAGTLVIGVHPGFIDTDMTATVRDAKIAHHTPPNRGCGAGRKHRHATGLTTTWCAHAFPLVAQ